MDTLTALRTFGNSSLTPTKGIKIFNDRWYFVMMQNTSRDQGDGYYLAEGEYSELLPGNKARERRDARLNHCNHIKEYTGPVFELFASEYGAELRSMGYFDCTANLEKKLDAVKAAHDEWVCACIDEAVAHENSAVLTERGLVTGFDADFNRRCAAECMAVAAAKCNKFRCDAKRIR